MTYMEQRGLNHFSELLYLLFATSNITIGHVRLLLHLLTLQTVLTDLINMQDKHQHLT